MKDNPTFSYQKVLAACDNNETLAQTMLDRYNQLFFDDVLQQLHQSIIKDDHADIPLQLHKLWINFLYIGAVYGEKIVQELENNLPKNNKDELLGIYLELLAESSEIKKQVAKALNKSADIKEIEQYESEVKKNNSKAKISNIRGKLTNSDLKTVNKESHIKAIQDKISHKEGASEVLEKQKLSIYKRDSEPRLPESRIIDYEQNTVNVHQKAHEYKSQIESSINPRQSPIMAAEPSQIKLQPQISAQSQQETANLKPVEIVAKVENNISAKVNGITGGNIVQPVQRLVQIVQDLSYDKIEGEVEKIHIVVRQALIMGIEEVVPELKAAAKQHSKELVVAETLKLLKQIQNSRSTLFQKGIEAPTVAELEQYEKEIKNKFSLKGEYGVDVVLEGKKDSSKKTTCCMVF